MVDQTQTPTIPTVDSKADGKNDMFFANLAKSPGPYIPGTSWSYWKRMFLNYLAIRQVTDNRIKVLVLLTELGQVANTALEGLLHGATPEGKPFDDLLSILEKHYTPKVLVLAERYKLLQVVLKDGTRLPASCVVAGVGVDPDTTWLKNHNVALDERGFIKVNDKFATSIPDVYAIGDAISAPLPFWGIDTINIQHFQVAQRHGQLAAWSILGKPQPGKLIPYFWTLFFFEKGIKFAGCSEGYDEIYTKGDVDSLEFVKYYLKNNQVIAVSSGGPAGASIQFLALCEQGKHISREDVEKNSTDDWAFMLK